ncbi:MAG: DUF1570 domain-containing protein [Kiritimatiellae bacterium]|nr:DUF1570 domain-containing protein [Kiritimatiellia bacterium]
MRLNASIAAVCLTLAAEAAPRFSEPEWRPDLGIMLPGLVAAEAVPTRLPKAEAYMVTSPDGKRRLEDRFDVFDLWLAATVRGRWRDADGNELQIARLAVRSPNVSPGTVGTRREFYDEAALRTIDPKRLDLRDEAVRAAAPVEVSNPVRPRRSNRKNLQDVVYYPSTNDNVLACAFRPRSPERKETPDWYLAVLSAAPGSDIRETQAWFDEAFLDRISVPARRARPEPASAVLPPVEATEDELLVRDVRNNVVNYDNWHCASAEDVLVVDNLDSSVRGPFVASLTNNLPRLRREYAKCVPTPLEATNQTAIVRVFKSREEYLGYVGIDKKWTAALWSPAHRELVLYHPESGVEKLLHTVWHEAFHQYLAYAGSMVSSSPWFNEGHAQLFENSHFGHEGQIVFDRDEQAASYVQSFAAELAQYIPSLLEMDYEAFYAGNQEEIAAKYRLAWSIAYFLEIGAPKLRYRPYENLRSDYVKALIRTRSMHEATGAVFDEQTRERFIAAWLDFWKQQ